MASLSGVLGLVIHGKVYHNPDVSLRPSSAARYNRGVGLGRSKLNEDGGYWRSQDKDTLRQNFDVLNLPLEETSTSSAPISNGCCSESVSRTLSAVVGSAVEPDCLGLNDTTVTIQYSDSNERWEGTSGDIALRLSCSGSTWTLALSCDSFVTSSTATPTDPTCDSTGLELDFMGISTTAACCSASDTFHIVVTGSVGGSGSSGVTDENTGNTYLIEGGDTSWSSAGEFSREENMGARALFLSEKAHINAGSLNSFASEFTVYTSIKPSSEMSARGIISKQGGTSQGRLNIFDLDIDYNGKYSVSADTLDTNNNISTYTVTSKNTYDKYAYPVHLTATYGSGDYKLKLYVNGEIQGESSVFIRNSTDVASSGNIFIGKRERSSDEGAFTGWIGEVGLASTCMSSGDVYNLYTDTFNLGALIDESVDIDPSGEFGLGFNSSFDVHDSNYVQFVVQSGDGVFDTTFGTSNYAPSSQLSVRKTNASTNLHQINELSTSMWIKHETNHASGAFVSALLKKNPNAPLATRTINWASEEFFVPSSDFQRVTLSGTMSEEVFPLQGPAIYPDLNYHDLCVQVRFPSGNTYFDSRFKIYSARLNLDAFYLPSADANTAFLYAKGNSWTAAAVSGVPLFVESSRAIRGLDLFLQVPDIFTTIPFATHGHSAASGIIDLFVEGGTEKKALELFLKSTDWTSHASDLPLYTQGGINVIPAASNNIPLFLAEYTAKAGKLNTNLNLSIPYVGNGAANTNIELFTRGHVQGRTANIPLFVDGPKSYAERLNLFLEASYQAASSTLPLYLERGTAAAVPLFIEAIARSSGNTPLFSHGHTIIPSAIGLSMPYTQGTSTDSISLSIYGDIL